MYIYVCVCVTYVILINQVDIYQHLFVHILVYKVTQQKPDL